MDSFITLLKKTFGFHYRLVLTLLIAVALLIFFGLLSYVFPSLVDTEVAEVGDWTVDQKQQALEELHEAAKQQGVVEFSTEEKMKILEQTNHGPQ